MDRRIWKELGKHMSAGSSVVLETSCLLATLLDLLRACFWATWDPYGISLKAMYDFEDGRGLGSKISETLERTSTDTCVKNFEIINIKNVEMLESVPRFEP